jgi:GNAT superfamily N-acetyltransferase
MPTIDVTRTYLEMKTPPAEPPGAAPAGVRLEAVKNCPWHLYRYLYTEVGKAYHWVDRLPWGKKEHSEWLAGPSTVWLLSVNGAPAGFFDLRDEGDEGVEVALFGLMPEFVGQGLGKWLLARAIEEAWATGTHRVWLHTCTLDHPSALPNYKKRGFTFVRTEVYQTEMADG